ncbi:MAG: TRAP transporter large permease, partial [Pseudomonadales bacterium]
MTEFIEPLVVVALLLALLAGGLWIGLALLAVAAITLELFTPRAAGDALAIAVWGSLSSWTLTALPLFLWMGTILGRTRIAEALFAGLSTWVGRLPGGLLHANTLGCTVFAAVSGSSAATCATIGRMTLPELARRGYPDSIAIGTLAGASTLGLLIPPSIIMIVYGVAAEVSIPKLFAAGLVPGLVLAGLFMGYTALWALRHPGAIPLADPPAGWVIRLRALKQLAPIALLMTAVLGSIYGGVATATEAAAIGVLGALALAGFEGSLDRRSFMETLAAACRQFSAIALILAGAASLTLTMGYLGLPRDLAAAISALELSPWQLIAALLAFYVVLGCFLDGISAVVLTVSIIMPTVIGAGIDPLWFGVFTVIAVEMAQITPPVGFNLFVLQGMTGRELPWIARVAAPMCLVML